MNAAEHLLDEMGSFGTVIRGGTTGEHDDGMDVVSSF